MLRRNGKWDKWGSWLRISGGRGRDHDHVNHVRVNRVRDRVNRVRDRENRVRDHANRVRDHANHAHDCRTCGCEGLAEKSGTCVCVVWKMRIVNAMCNDDPSIAFWVLQLRSANMTGILSLSALLSASQVVC